jgi:hypothetical protein
MRPAASVSWNSTRRVIMKGEALMPYSGRLLVFEFDGEEAAAAFAAAVFSADADVAAAGPEDVADQRRGNEEEPEHDVEESGWRAFGKRRCELSRGGFGDLRGGRKPGSCGHECY